MKRSKPVITLSVPAKHFQKDGVVISQDEALKLWKDGTADWSLRAYQFMSIIVVCCK
jgi:hypothetical protein